MWPYHRIKLKNKAKKELWARELARRGRKTGEGRLQIFRGPQKISELGTCVLLMSCLTQTNGNIKVMTISMPL